MCLNQYNLWFLARSDLQCYSTEEATMAESAWDIPYLNRKIFLFLTVGMGSSAKQKHHQNIHIFVFKHSLKSILAVIFEWLCCDNFWYFPYQHSGEQSNKVNMILVFQIKILYVFDHEIKNVQYNSKRNKNNFEETNKIENWLRPVSGCYFFDNWFMKLKFPLLTKPLGTIFLKKCWSF